MQSHSLEQLTSVSNLAAATEGTADGARFELQYSGDTEIFWDEQKPVIRDGQRVFIDIFGGEWLENQLVLTDDPNPSVHDDTPTDATPNGQATGPTMFRHLDATEANEFRAWAHANYAKGAPIKPTWHPIVRAECEAINAAK